MEVDLIQSGGEYLDVGSRPGVDSAGLWRYIGINVDMKQVILRR